MGRSFQDSRDTDLFGKPVRPSKGRRGRPCLEVDSEDRDMVEAALARGWTVERIAKVLGISPASLKRHFRAELDKREVARDRLELAAFRKLARDAIEGGNASAMRQLREIMAQDALRSNRAEIERRQKEAEAHGIGMAGGAGATKGKKAQAQAEAEAAADGWGGLLTPLSDLH